jgi:heme exporter protein C
LTNNDLEKLIRQSWWKISGILVLAGALLFAMKTPLSPGILSIEKVEQAEQTLSFELIGYNSHFMTSNGLQVWIQNDAHSYCSKDLEIIDDSHLLIGIDLPEILPSNLFSVVLNDDIDGTLASLDGIFIKGDVKPSEGIGKCHEQINVTEHGYFSMPYRTILYETIRNLNFHVPMWFAMIFLTLFSFVTAILYLVKSDPRYDDMTVAAIHVAMLFAICGLSTGALWARFTWGAFWTDDPQLNGAAISTLIYLAYFMLRRSVNDPDKRARLSAVYAIFAFIMFYVFLKVIPSMAEFSLHPDTTDNPSFKDYDIEGKLKIVFRTATAGWIILSFWIFSLRYRLLTIERKRLDHE